jgi:outer membrane protein assembly factor BamD
MISKSKLIAPAVLCTLIWGGCAENSTKEPESAEQIYRSAIEAFNNEDYSEAISAFYKLKYDYPAKADNALTDLKIADSHFYNKDYNEAIVAYEDFRKLHPTSQYIPYAIYQLGICHYNQILAIDRDQKHTQMALNEFYYLLTNYKTSRYARAAYEKFLDCQKRLSAREAYVAHFYYKKGKYKAAVRRFEFARSNFPSIALKDDMLYFLTDAYLHLGEQEKAMEIYKLLSQNYPESKYVKKARSLLQKKLKREISEVLEKEGMTEKFGLLGKVFANKATIEEGSGRRIGSRGRG